MFDRLLDWLMRPRVRRVRRWSFVLTVPAAVVGARLFAFEHGVLVAVVAAIAWQVNLLMHAPAPAYTGPGCYRSRRASSAPSTSHW